MHYEFVTTSSLPLMNRASPTTLASETVSAPAVLSVPQPVLP
jgi:hypothetical protein